MQSSLLFFAEHDEYRWVSIESEGECRNAATHLGHAEHNPSGNDRFCVLGPLIVSLSFKAEEEGGKQRTAMQYTPGTMGRLF